MIKKWITEFISEKSYETRKEALEQATKLIESWCEENKLKYEIWHNPDTSCNRVLKIETKNWVYTYKFIISACNVETGNYEESKNLFGKKWLKPIYKNEYYAHLDRIF